MEVQMTGSNWETDEKGNLIVAPLLNWSTGQAHGTLCLVRLEYAKGPNDLDKKRESVQLVLPPLMALALSEQLKTLATELMRPVSGQTKQ
jgi:hypothetical protein